MDGEKGRKKGMKKSLFMYFGVKVKTSEKSRVDPVFILNKVFCVNGIW